MKKLLLAAIFVLAVFAASAREPVIRYQGDLQTGYSWGGENLSRFNLLHMVNSVRITRYISLGVGVGVDVHTEKYRAGSYYGIPIMEKGVIFCCLGMGNCAAMCPFPSGWNSRWERMWA